MNTAKHGDGRGAWTCYTRSILIPYCPAFYLSSKPRLNLFTCFSSRHLIRDAIFANDFLKNLEKFQVREIVSCMYPKEYDKDNYIIKEGEIGHALFVISGNSSLYFVIYSFVK